MPCLPTRNDIVAEIDEGLSAILNNALAEQEEIPFMAIDFEGSSEKIGEKNHYVLRLYGSLINGQKAVVTFTGIQIFFDTLVPVNEFVDDFKIKIDTILSSIINTYKIEYIKAFPLRGYYTEKKSYLRIFTLGSGDRKKVLQAIQDNNFEIASDDMFSFHHKIARENGIVISAQLASLGKKKERLGKMISSVKVK
ncbi:10351_t:CDS:2, partial [Dentiscutata erythropus]